MTLTGRTSFPPLCCTFQIPAQSHQSGSEAPPRHRTIPRISLTHGRLPATTYPLAEICFRSANANKKPQLDLPPTTHLPHSFISGWPAQQLPPLLPSFLPSFDSNPLTQKASKDKKSPAKVDYPKSLQKSKKIQTYATVLDLWSKEEHKLLQGAVNWKLLYFSYATQNSETPGGGRKPSDIVQRRFCEKISRCNSCADARDLQRHRASESASARAREERQKGEGELDERERAGSCDLSTPWPLAHRTWGGRGPLC